MSMSSSKLPDLMKVTEIFLIPSSFMVAALGTADSNLHRAMVSAIGLLVSVFWYACSREALSEISVAEERNSRRVTLLGWLSLVFLVSWLVSLVGHLVVWDKPLGTNVLTGM
jgi:hypothetical protein